MTGPLKLGRHHGMAVRLPGASPPLDRWVGVYGLSFGPNPSTKTLVNVFKLRVPNDCEVAYRVRVFDLDPNYDHDQYWPCEDDLKNAQEFSHSVTKSSSQFWVD
jgi:hypothetical protein